MNGPSILDLYRNRLREDIVEGAKEFPRCEPINISPWLAMSLMQKAIRRGRDDLALKGAATLLEDSPDRLWRRLCITAYEDIGVADFDAVALVTAALKGKRWRAGAGGDWAVASHLIRRMCRSVKCRAADDLLVVCERHPDFEYARLDLTFKPVPELLDRVASKVALPERGLALWYAVGTYRCRSSLLRERRGDPQAVLDALCQRGYPETVVEVCREGLRKSGEILPPFLILLRQAVRRVARHTEPDDLPDEEMAGGVPCWAFDMFVRQGNQAMARFLKTGCETVRWLDDHYPDRGRNRFLGGMVFRVEGGLVDRRLRWGMGDRLRRMSDLESRGLDPKDMEEGLHLLRRDLPLLHEARRGVAGSNFR